MSSLRKGESSWRSLYRCPWQSARGFTLIELLVVIAIIGILVALILPAVQAAREAARRLECSNHLKQTSTAVLLHENTYRHLPTGGCGKEWAALPELGVDGRQPGGWIFNVLLFIEQQGVHDLGGISPTALNANRQRLQAALPVMHCPSRRSAQLFANYRTWQPPSYPLVADVARNDYAMNGGDRVMLYGTGPPSLAAANSFAWPDMSLANGVCFQRSRLRLAEVTDGTSNTYLVGEKHLRRDHYNNGQDQGDNESMYSGDDRDLIRFTGTSSIPTLKPLSDAFVAGQEGLVFGSDHSSGFQVAFKLLCVMVPCG
jgi:prepilin-type N-terminal cleavage/methylation domain-containing protein